MRIAYKQYPSGTHQYGVKSAMAAIGAQRQDKFWEYHDLIFKEAENLTDDKLTQTAQKLGLDMDKFIKESQDVRTINLLRKDVTEGTSLGLDSTLSVFVNGVIVRDMTMEGLEKAVQGAMQNGVNKK